MSVVAGCSLFDGVLLTADCRSTYRRPGGPDVHVDNAQKLFVIAPGTAIGFVGDIEMASYLLRELFSQLRHRRRKDPFSLSMWLPRFFRSAHTILAQRLGPRDIRFMVASAIRGRPNIVEREDIGELFRHMLSDENPWGKSGTMPGFLYDILQDTSQYKRFSLAGTSASMLYVMRSPHFKIESYRPLQFAAIGSGESAIEEIALWQHMIVLRQPGNSRNEAFFLREAVRYFVQQRGIQDVGGLYPVVKVIGEWIDYIGF